MKVHRNLKIVLFLLLVTVAIYFKAAHFPFCEIDDRDYASANAHVASGLNLDSITWAFTTFHASNWHPLTWLSLLADSQFFGTTPTGYHIMNVALHALATTLLFLLFESLTKAPWRSAFVAACFALHPCHVESVAWISERKDVLSAVFWMLTLICYHRYVRDGKRGMYLLSLAVFALGLMAKPMLVTIPVVLLILDLWPLQRLRVGAAGDERTQWRGLLAEKVPYLLLTLASAAITMYAQHHGGAMVKLHNLSLMQRVSNALWSMLMYIIKLFWPVNLGIYYPLTTIAAWQAGVALVLIIAVTWIAMRELRSRPWIAAGWLWYLVTLLPVIGLIQVGAQAMADRYTYIPYIGLFVIIAWGGAEIGERVLKSRQVVGAVAGIVLAVLAAVTWFQLDYWDDNLTLLSHTVAITGDNYVVSYALALAYEKEGKPEDAIGQYRKAIKSFPANPDIHQLYLHLGNLLNAQGETTDALQQYDEAIRVNPGFWQAYYNRGLAFEKVGNLDEALRNYGEVLKLKPDDAPTLNNIGLIEARKGALDAAIREFTAALQADPTMQTARDNLEMAKRQRGH